MLENVRALEGAPAPGGWSELRALPIVGDVRGAGFFWAVELVQDADGTPFDRPSDEQRLVRGFMPGRLLEAGPDRPRRRPRRRGACRSPRR